jgi:cell wall-associated NlpC family hydrolase
MINETLKKFMAVLLKQDGKPYIYGIEVKLDDPDPQAFDCSELVQWACHQAGITVPDGAVNQYAWLKKLGRTIPVQAALHTRGALLFKRDKEKIHHVGVAIGDGLHTFEAKGKNYGVGVFRAGEFNDRGEPRGWNLAGIVPGLEEGSQTQGSQTQGSMTTESAPTPAEKKDNAK